MKTKLKMKCKECGNWNSIEVEKVMFNPDSPDPKVQIFIPSYLPLKTENCEKCGCMIAEPETIIRIIQG